MDRHFPTQNNTFTATIIILIKVKVKTRKWIDNVTIVFIHESERSMYTPQNAVCQRFIFTANHRYIESFDRAHINGKLGELLGFPIECGRRELPCEKILEMCVCMREMCNWGKLISRGERSNNFFFTFEAIFRLYWMIK